MAVERIQIEVAENGSRVVKRNLEEIGGSARLAASGVDFLKAALAGLTFKAAADIIDSYSKMQNKIATVTKSQGELAAVTQRLYEIAQTTRQGIAETTEAYFRFNNALEKLGYSQNDVLGMTETISKAFIVAGASADEAERAMIQLAQGFSKNKLQTQDLKAALEQAPYVISVLARNLNIAGVSAAQAEFGLYDLAEQGKLTTKVMYDAFKKAREEIEQKFLKTLPTIEQGVIAITRAFTRWIGETAKSSGFANAVGEALQSIARNFDQVASYVAAAATAFGTFFLITRGIPAIVGIIATIGAALFTLPGLIAAAAGAFVLWGDKIKLAGSETATLKDLAVVAFDTAKEALGRWTDSMAKKFPELAKLAKTTFGNMDFSLKGILTTGVEVTQGLSVLFSAAYETIIEQWKLLPAALYDVMVMAVNKSTQVIAEFLNYVYNGIKGFIGNLVGKQFDELKLGGTSIAVTGAAERISNIFTEKIREGMANLTPAGIVVQNFYKAAEEQAKKSAEEQKKALETVKKATEDLNAARENRKPAIAGEVQIILNNLQKEAEVLRFVNDEYTVRHQLLNIEKNLHRDLESAERSALDAAIRRNIELERQKNLLEQIRQPQTDYQQGLNALNALMQSNKITQEEYNSTLDQMTLKYLNALPAATTFMQGFTRQLQIMSIETKNATAIMGTELAKIFGPGGALSKGIGDAVAQALVFGKSWKDAIRGVAQSILSQLISALVQMGINMMLQSVMGQAQMAAVTATSTASAAAVTAAWTPAATMTSLATGGANAAGAASGIGSIMGIMGSLAGVLGGFFKGFKDGGYTGPVGTNQVAGLVHGQEFVMNAAATRKHRTTLEALNAGKEIGQTVVGPAPQPVSVAITNQIPDAAYEVRQLTETDIEIIATRIVHREAPGVVANDLRNPNGRASKAMTSNLTTGRRR